MKEDASIRNQRDDGSTDSGERRGDLMWATAGGAIAAVAGFSGMAVVGNTTAFEARRLLEAALPTVRFAAAAYIGGGATVLALMLTLLTFSISHELDFRPTHYRRIRDISFLTAALIVASVMLLMFLSFPIGEADVQRGWYLWVYYAVLLAGSLTGGAFISMMLMLFYAVRGLIGVGVNPTSSSLVDTP